MPVPQISPPGFLDQHGVVVALTPVLLCLVTAAAVWFIGERASTRRLTAVRMLAAVSLLGALVLQGLFLLPWGAAAAYSEALGGGWIRVGWLVTGTAFVLGCWSLWFWSPLRRGVDGSAAVWCLRVALALALPVWSLPVLVIAVLADDRRASGERCFLVAALAVFITAVLMPGMTPEHRWWSTAMVMFVAYWVVVGPWRLPLAAAMVAGVLSW